MRLRELAVAIQPTDLANAADTEPEFSHLQRLGWLLDRIERPDLADPLHPSLSKRPNLSRSRLDPAEGSNALRYHSCCPPESAFLAADELGIVIQAEAGIWIDRWMGKFNPDRMDMWTKGEPPGLGNGDAATDGYVQAEIHRILDAYGNSPSFAFFAIGNELGPCNFNAMNEWIGAAKKHDPRRLYMCSTAREVKPNDDYMVTHSYPGIGWVRQRYEKSSNLQVSL